MQMSIQNRIERRADLTAESLERLIADETLALVVADYYPEDLSERLGQRILANDQVEPYTHEQVEGGELVQKYFGVDRLGLPFNLTYDQPQDSPIVERYYSQAATSLRHLRSLSAPAAAPIDKLRLELDEHYPAGSTVASFQGRKMLAGIGRITKAALSHLSAEQPHFDALPQNLAPLTAQLAANIYLKVPPIGGELELWDVKPMHPLAIAPDDWRAALPSSIKIAPRCGDLVIFNCRRPHAIGTFEGEDRVTVQMFIGYEPGRPLQLWN